MNQDGNNELLRNCQRKVADKMETDSVDQELLVLRVRRIEVAKTRASVG